MTTEQYFAFVKGANQKILAAAKKAYEELIRKIRGGMSAQQAAREVLDTFNEEYAAILAAGVAEVGNLDEFLEDIRIGGISLSQKLYTNAQSTSLVVEGVVLDHRRGLQDARALALELYEGYGFNPEEPLVISSKNKALPKFLRKAILTDNPTQRDMARAFARAQTKALRTGALQAAYKELLNAIDTIADGSAANYLDKKLQVAFEEKMRYFAKRIAETELHRAFAIEQAVELMADTDVAIVEARLNPAHPVEDICDYFTRVDRYGLGPGVYPKEEAPVFPAHPFCKCVLAPRLDISVRDVTASEEADQAYFRKLSPKDQRKVAGSGAKLDRILGGESAWDVHNSRIDPTYQVRSVQEVAR